MKIELGIHGVRLLEALRYQTEELRLKCLLTFIFVERKILLETRLFWGFRSHEVLLAVAKAITHFRTGLLIIQQVHIEIELLCFQNFL